MRHTLARVALHCSLAIPLASVAASQDDRADELDAALASAVDRASPEERQEAALALAARSDVELSEWLDACARFGPRGEGTRGQRIEQVDLYAEGEIESTPLMILVPESYRAETPAPLLMTFHFTGGRGEHMVGPWRDVAEELGMLVCAPSETSDNDGYRFTQRERDVALSALRWMRREFNVDENRIFATGISRGGHQTWDLVLRHPDLFAGAAPMIGGPYFDLRAGRANLRYLENLTHVVLHGLQGAQDQPGLVWNVRFAFERLEELEITNATYHEFPDLGHSMDLEAVDWRAFFQDTRRDPRPELVVRRFARPGEGRSYWVNVLEGTKGCEEEFTPTITKSKKDRLDDEGLRRWVIDETEKKTARLEAKFVRANRVEVKAKMVESFELLLTANMFDADETFEVKVGSRRKKREVEASAEVLLAEFVERFDRTFLPTARVVID